MEGGKYRNPIDKARRDYEYKQKDKKWATLEAGEQISKIIKERDRLNDVLFEVSKYVNKGHEYIDTYDNSLNHFARQKPMIEAAKKANVPLSVIKDIEYTPSRFKALTFPSHAYSSDRAGPYYPEISKSGKEGTVTIKDVEGEPDLIYIKLENSNLPIEKIDKHNLNEFIKKVGLNTQHVNVKENPKRKTQYSKYKTKEQKKADLEYARQQISLKKEREEYEFENIISTPAVMKSKQEHIPIKSTPIVPVEDIQPALFSSGKTQQEKEAEELAERQKEAVKKEEEAVKKEEVEEDPYVLSKFTPEEIEQRRLIALERKQEFEEQNKIYEDKLRVISNEIHILTEEAKGHHDSLELRGPYVQQYDKDGIPKPIPINAKGPYVNRSQSLRRKLSNLKQYAMDKADERQNDYDDLKAEYDKMVSKYNSFKGEGYYQPRFRKNIYRY